MIGKAMLLSIGSILVACLIGLIIYTEWNILKDDEIEPHTKGNSAVITGILLWIFVGLELLMFGI